MGGWGPATAVVVDRWPLVRLGLVGVLTTGGLNVVGQAAKVSEGLLLVRMRDVDLIVFGSPEGGLSPAAVRSVKRDSKPPKILVLVPPSDAATSRPPMNRPYRSLSVTSSRASGAGAYSQGIAWPSPRPQLEGAR